MGSYQGWQEHFRIHPDIRNIMQLGEDTWICTDGGINYSNENREIRLRGLHGQDFWGFSIG